MNKDHGSLGADAPSSALLDTRQFIELIKQHRIANGSDLRTAKLAVEGGWRPGEPRELDHYIKIASEQPSTAYWDGYRDALRLVRGPPASKLAEAS